MHAGHTGDEPEASNEWTLAVVGARFRGVPVDRGAVENRARQVSQQPLTRRHASSLSHFLSEPDERPLRGLARGFG